MSYPPDGLRDRLQQFDQLHLLQFWDDLDEDQQRQLVAQIEAVDFEQLAQLAGTDSAETDSSRADRAGMPSRLVTAEDENNAEDWARARVRGQAALEAGRVGVILVAGGQGTRLGFPHPKGMFPVGPVSGNSLFQLLSEQVVARAARAGVTIPYYVMTSDATHEETVQFFAAHDHFGLDPAGVWFFRQGNMPAVDAASGRVLRSGQHTLARSPDGHGGLLQALLDSKLLERMEADGIERLYYHQVDNPTAIVLDPAFIGFHEMFDSELSTKVVRKTCPTEKMGVIVDVDGDVQIIEYSELTEQQAGRCDEAGDWIFWAGNTAIHIFDRDFLATVARSDQGLPFHRARKNVPFIDGNGTLQKPDDPAAPNAIKFERFIFDALPMARNALVVEADRSREFNPVKNRQGQDSPDTAKAAISRIGREWLRRSGQQVADDAIVEISPLRALEAEDVRPESRETLAGPILLR